MTQAEMWIASRKTSPRRAAKSLPAPAGGAARRSLPSKKHTPLRLTVLRQAQSAHKRQVTKIQAPTQIDHTKQAAIMLMTGHTAKGPSPRGNKTTPSFVAKKRSPAARASRTPRRSPKAPPTRTSKRGSASGSVSILEISDSTQCTTRSGSPLLPTPRKSALKGPGAARKHDSIKFDLSNLEPAPTSDDELTLHYSDTSSTQSPSPRKGIHSRSSRMLEKSLGTSPDVSRRSRSTLTAVSPESPRRKSSRGTLILQKALDASQSDDGYSRRTTRTLTDRSADATVASAFRTRTLSPRSPAQNLETYSIVDLVSMDSNESGRSTSVYNSAGSIDSSATAFGTPQNSIGRRTRSTIDPSTLLGSSTPYVKPTRSSSLKSQGSRKSSIKNSTNVSTRSSGPARRSKSLTTPENSRDTQRHISVNSTRISRASKSRSRINDTDLMLISSSDISQMEDASPLSSRRVSQKSPQNSPAPTRKSSRRSGGDATPDGSEKENQGTSTPQNRHSPEEAGTPVLSIQSLLDSSQSSFASQNSSRKGRGGSKRKTIGVIRSQPRGRPGVKSKSLSFTARRGLLRLSKDSSLASDKTDEGAPKPSNEKMVTPKSAVKLVQEAVKNKHSTAKKPQSKRSIIDDLNESDIVKQLFSSPVKRKLSQSMTEFSRKQLFDDDDDVVVNRRPTRNTIAVANRTPDNSILDRTEPITPEVFVSPIGTPADSPNLSGIKRLFRKNTPNNDLRNVRGVKGLLRTPRTRRSIKNDLSDVAGIKQVFAKSPKNRLSDVRVKEVFAEGPKNDLRRVSGVKSLFRSQKERASPRNDLTDVRGVKNLFQRSSPRNDLRRVSGVKKTMRKNSPKNDLSDVRGVKKLFKGSKARNDLNDVSGVEELFNESGHSVPESERLFDQLLGKPPIKAVYSKSFAKKTTAPKTRARAAKSLHASIDVITNNVEDWLERELQKRLHKDDVPKAVSKELQKLSTATVEGAEPLRTSRVRTSTVARAEVSHSQRKKSASELYGAHTLPLKKRSLADAPDTAPDGPDAPDRLSLPLKKRAVVHSTPVKGRARTTLNASELGRVSPIQAADTSLRSESTLAISEPKPTKAKRTTKAAVEIEAPKQAAKSPPKANASKSSPRRAPEPRATRARGAKADRSQTQTKKRRTSLVISKKSPVMSPKPAPRTKRGKAEPQPDSPLKPQPKQTRGRAAQPPSPKPSPKKTRGKATQPQSPIKSSPKKRGTRKQEDKPATPKRPTRAKVQKASVVVGKPSPKMKPQAKSKSEAKVTMSESPKTKRQVASRAAKTQDQVNSPRKSRKTAASEKSVERVEIKSRRRKVESPKKSPQPARTRRAAENEPKSKRSKAVSESDKNPEPEKKGRKGRKTQVVEEKPEPKRTRKTQDESKRTVAKESPKPIRSRGRKLEAQESVQSEPPTRTRRGKGSDNATVIPEVASRKRKTTAENVIPAKVTKTSAKEVVETKSRRGRKTTIETVEVETGSVRQKRSVIKDSKVSISSRKNQDGSRVENVRTVRSRKLVVTAVETSAPKPKAARGGKATAKENETKTNTRKKKTESSPAKQASPEKRTRRAARPQEETTKATGRSRRR
ncbi:serine/arginine repetitive matrix protein 2-like [Ostrinia nubilalis]|uniref:serine/arginine repetitive matrix protein 2-like n=1 Tax=Ostrinia nubilalis TaxID=29057 RepID=UPI0030826B37